MKHPKIYHEIITSDGKTLVLYDKQEATEIAIRQEKIENIKEHLKCFALALTINTIVLIIAVFGIYRG